MSKWMALLLLFLPLLAFSETLNSYQQALENAKKQNRIALIMMESAYCPWCRKMKRATLQDPAVKLYLEKHFVLAILDNDRDNFPKELKTRLVPTVHFVDAGGEVIWQTIGYRDSNAFIEEMTTAIDLHKGE